MHYAPKNYKKRTPRDLAENHRSRRHIAKLLRSRLVSGPDLRSQRVGSGSAPDTEDGKVACKNFQATITEVYASESSDQHWSVNVSIWTLLYGSKSLEEILQHVRPPAVEPQLPVCIWIHIPENNMIWVEDLFAKIGVDPTVWDETRPSVNPNRTITPHLGNKNIHTESVRSVFLPYLSYEANVRQDKRNECIQNADDAYRRHGLSSRTFSRSTTLAVPRTVTETTMTADTVRGELLQVPESKDADHYPHVPDLDDSDSDISEDFEVGNRDDLEEEEKALMRYYLNSPPALHVRRTLDQYYYHMLESTQDRDKDQVVSRWYQRVKGQSRHNILMVDQLWLWTTWKKPPKTTIKDIADIASAARKQQHLDSSGDGDGPKLAKDRYVVSCFPGRIGTKDALHRTTDDLRQIILDPHGRKRDPIQQPEDLISRILQTCFGTFDRLQDAESLRFFQMFEDSVSAIDDKETRLFGAFKRGSARLLELNSVNKYYEARKSELLINLLDIRNEIELLVEVKDIRDEINIILSVLHIQKSMVEQMTQDKSTIRGLLRNDTVENMVKADIDDFTKLDGQARSIQEKLNTLMDLKQKAANAWEAREARETAVAASKQGNTVMVFTVVTIVFLPLSFLSSFFTIGIAAFPKDAKSGETNWPLGFILALLFGISICVSLPLVLFALNMDAAKQKITELRRTRLSYIAIKFIDLLSPASTGNKTNSYRNYWRRRLQNYRNEYIKWRDDYIRGEAGDEDEVGGLAEMIRKMGPTDPFPLDVSHRRLFGSEDDEDVPLSRDTRRRARDIRTRVRGEDNETLVGG
ncbi:hypothetical protein K491DRAFT_261624 [Lophiostoma macrostomum CBS 122681]|uniref:Cora-domain-containing protein n=1 Tax=Lophiostoma macrostomum CBS 122681 TaxID=1314788 RepID=A0A6A6SM66_9PLEO|nr:hypothetical protein K491DRAFT_261624 [Lophiostoma macrostomum CBS 122681]